MTRNPRQPPPLPPQHFESTRTWRQILAETFQIYRRGFARFMLFGLLTSVPMFVLQWTLPKIPLPDLTSGSRAIHVAGSASDFRGHAGAAAPGLAGFQPPVFNLSPTTSCAVQARSFGAQFSRRLCVLWGHVLGAALLVYGSYFFWFFVPLGGHDRIHRQRESAPGLGHDSS